MKLKKILAICLGIFILVGCTNTNNNPSKKVEDFLSKYQKLDDDVLTQLDLTLDNDQDMSDDQKKDYRALMEKQYQNLSYKITDEKEEDDTATVEAEIEVYDYQTSVTKSTEYFNSHKDEFVTDTDKDGTKKFIDYKIKEMKNVSDKTKYTMTFNLTKNNGEWILDDITDTDRQKLHGLY